MASQADRELLRRWNRQREDEDQDEYGDRIGNPPDHIIEAYEHCSADAEGARWVRMGRVEWGRGEWLGERTVPSTPMQQSNQMERGLVIVEIRRHMDLGMTTL
jgi:hypothetical protein